MAGLIHFQQQFQDAGGGSTPPPPTITLADLPSFSKVVTLYNNIAMASGGTAPYFYEIESGSLPPGLSLHPTIGRVFGTTSLESADYSFTIKVTDSNGHTKSREYTIEVNEFYNYLERVIAQGDDVTGAKVNLYKTFFKSIPNSRPKVGRFSTWRSNTFTGAPVPQINSFDGATIVGDSIDTLVNVTSGDWDAAQGITGDGSTIYVKTGFIPSDISEWELNSAAFGVGKSGGTSGSRCLMAAADVPFTKKAMLFDQWGGGAPLIAMNTTTNDIYGASPLADGRYYVIRTKNADYDIYVDGVYDDTITRAADIIPDVEFLLFEGNGGGYKFNGTIHYYLIAPGFTSSDVAEFDAALSTLLTGLAT